MFEARNLGKDSIQIDKIETFRPVIEAVRCFFGKIWAVMWSHDLRLFFWISAKVSWIMCSFRMSKIWLQEWCAAAMVDFYDWVLLASIFVLDPNMFWHEKELNFCNLTSFRLPPPNSHVTSRYKKHPPIIPQKRQKTVVRFLTPNLWLFATFEGKEKFIGPQSLNAFPSMHKTSWRLWMGGMPVPTLNWLTVFKSCCRCCWFWTVKK